VRAILRHTCLVIRSTASLASWLQEIVSIFKKKMTRPEILKMRPLPSILRILLCRSSAILFKVHDQSKLLNLDDDKSLGLDNHPGFSQTQHAASSASEPFGYQDATCLVSHSLFQSSKGNSS
jgi:hypothetical protein